MKFSSVFVAVTFILVAEIAADVRKDCRRETSVSWASLRRLKAGNFEQNDPRLHCYLRCFMMKNGILRRNGDIDVEKALRLMPRSMQDSSRKILNQCKTAPEKDPCEKAYQMAKCFVKNQPEILKSVPLV